MRFAGERAGEHVNRLRQQHERDEVTCGSGIVGSCRYKTNGVGYRSAHAWENSN